MPRTVLERLVDQLPLAKRQTLRRIAQAGRVRVNGQVVTRLSTPVEDADIVAVSARAEERERDDRPAPPRGPALAVVYEDLDLLVLNKPAGLLTSTTPRERRATLLAQATAYLARREPRARIGLIHRLDRDASGLLIFSKNDPAYHALKDQFRRHDVQRIYGAVVLGSPPTDAGRIESNLLERADGTLYSSPEPGRGQRAITEFQLLKRTTLEGGQPCSVLRVRLETGRKHQIRVHLSQRHMPIVGDAMYGRARESGETPLLLSAVRLTVAHPRDGRRMNFRIDPPTTFSRYLADLPPDAWDWPQE